MRVSFACFSFRAAGISLVAATFLNISALAKEPPLDPPVPERPSLKVEGVGTNGWFRLGINNPRGAVYTVQRSADLAQWKTIAVLHGRDEYPIPVLPFVDAGSGAQPSFYRVTAKALEFQDDWRNQIFFDEDLFLSERVNGGLPETRWIKFAITTNEPARVYFQNSLVYDFHYEFAVARLPEFKGMSAAQFDAVSLHTNAQKVVLGAVLFSPMPDMREAAVQFVGQDAYAPEQIAQWFDVVRAAILPLEGLKVSYIPSYEQAAAAEKNRAFFEARGIQVTTLASWDTGENCYSPGWAIGTLKFIPASQIVAAYADGRLTPNDILLTDGIPAELPYLRGIISLAPSTPNSHVAILARSYAVPFAYFAEPELRALAQAAVGKEVIFSACQGYPMCDLRVLDLSGVDTALRQQIASAKEKPPLNITPKARFGAYTASTDTLTPADLKYFGGKAANFGFLRRQLPSNSPPALAISFDLWDDFMDQQLASGLTLRTAISNRLSKYTYPPDLAQLRNDLEVVREMIEDDTQFTAAQQQEIAAALLAKFDPQIKIRFRSSTNVEDTEQFVGAGLYDSYSGCLADDQDTNSSGPSICEAAEEKERGVFRAIRKVYASFYNENAFLERLRHRVDETKAGMAVLVHYSSPDETEMANGVATVSFQKQSKGDHHFQAKLVTQKGATSVANPDGTAQPEVVNLSSYGGGTYMDVRQWSSLVPFGATVLQRDAEYLQFTVFFSRAAQAFESYYPTKTNYTLDFEYKKIVPGWLMVKQIRQIPTPDADERSTTFLLNAPGEWHVFQGEFGDVVANHRLKAKFQLQTRDLQLTRSNLQSSFYGPVSIAYVSSNGLATLHGTPAEFPGASHSVGAEDPYGTPVTDSWNMNDKRVELSASIRESANPAQSPFVTLQDAHLTWTVHYPAPVPTLDYDGTMLMVTNESVRLTPPEQTNSRSLLQTRTTPASKGAMIRSQFYWPPPPQGNTVGYTAPLQQWVETRIEGLTTEPIVLKDYYSQSYRPEHHNFSENFLFEPALEPGISPAIIAELEARNIRYIYVRADAFDNETNRILVAGPDWHFRPLVPAGNP